MPPSIFSGVGQFLVGRCAFVALVVPALTPPLARAQGSDLTSVGGSAVADTSPGVTVAGGRQPPGTLPFIRGWTLDGHPTRRGRFGALL